MDLNKLKTKYRLSDLEIFSQNSSQKKISFSANKLKEAESSYSTGLAVRLICDKKIGFASSYGNTSPDDLIQNALVNTKYSEEFDITLPSDISQNSGTTVSKENPNELEQFEKTGNEIIEKISKEADCLIDISFDLHTTSVKIENTRGLSCLNQKDLYSMFINIRETTEKDFIEIHTGFIDSKNKLSNFSKYLNNILSFYHFSKKHAKPKNGSYSVLFTSKASKELLNIIELALNGKQVIQKASPWHNKPGERVLSKLITIRQDPGFGYMAREIDDEGSLVKPLVLINKGVLENFYFDLVTACRSDCPVTPTAGNGFKPSLSSPPEPALLNMIISPGKRLLEEIIKDIDYGLLIDQTMGGLTANISGDFSVNVELGFLIEKGEITGRVKDTMISGNIYTALNNVIELSKNCEFFFSNIYSPDMLLDGFIITGK